MLGGATKKAFTYGKRGRTTDQISTDDSTSGDDVHLRTTLVLPSQTKKASSSQTRPAATNHGRSAMTSPRSKGATSRAQLKKHQTEPQHHLASEPSKRALVPTQASLSHISSPRRVKVSRDRAKLRAAELLQPSPRRVQVDIETLDESGRRVRNERRMTRPEFETVPSHPTRPNALPSTSRVHVAGKAKQPMSFTRDMDDMPPTRASQIIDLTTPAMQRTSRSSAGLRPQVDSQSVRSVRHKTVTRAIIISSDDSDTGESHPQVFNGHKPRQHPIVISSDEQDGNTPVSRASKRAPSNPPSAPEPVPPSIAQDIASHPVSPPFAWAPVNHLHRGSQRASTPRRVSIGRQPRRLTPIVSRNGRKWGFPKRSTPITPDILTDSELDLTQDFANLDLSSASAGVEGTELSPEWLHGLLEECQQRGPHEFSAFVETFPFDPVVRSSDGTVSTPLQKFRKIGEASYSEVFGIGDVVLKVIPLRDIAEAATINDIPESPPPSDASDVLREIVVTREIASTCGDGFTRLLKTYVVRGKYPSRLLSLWDEYDAQKGSESIRPDCFTLNQVYAILVLPNGGPDLESFRFQNAARSGWRQAYNIFWQVAKSLAKAERMVRFEHRDLHWGQILLKYADGGSSSGTSVKTTIIDFGFARMEVLNGSKTSAEWTQIDEEVFEGTGEYQFEVYRMMRRQNGALWDAYCPMTNVLWLHYLSDKLLHAKKLVPPVQPTLSPKHSAPPSREHEYYERLVAIESLLGVHLSALRDPIKTRRKSVAAKKKSTSVSVNTSPASAGDVVRIALEKGWVNKRRPGPDNL